eukprot:TRINITY_DN688_c0_g1_i2.p1 TRINITY_DN688_c0_g1~~TRINITY_DN688_c0_g1_i2.p1  ORF type:complete len:957 (+),score=378.80 TRINITY_DN688_c0_g1_i2:113-2983(+)
MAIVAPTMEEMQQVAEIIRSGFESAHDPSVQMRVNQFLQEHAADPKFNVCLMEIATNAGSGLAEFTRAQAAMAFKQNTVRHFETAICPNVKYHQEKLKAALHDPSAVVRQALGPAISEVAKTGAWPTLVAELWPQLTQNNSPDFRSAVLGAVKDVCTYCADQLELVDAASNQCQASVLVPEMVSFVLKTEAPKEVSYATQGLFALLDYQSEEANSPIYSAFGQCLQQTVHALKKAMKVGEAASAESTRIVVAALGCYRLLLYYYTQLKAINALGEIMQMLFSLTSGHPNSRIALAACEFWRDLSKGAEYVNDLVDLRLVPDLGKMLLSKLVYDDDELAEIEGEEEYAPKANMRQQGSRPQDGDDDEDGEGSVQLWTLRRCAAETLEGLARLVPLVLLPPSDHEGGQKRMWFLAEQVLPRLQAQNWREQESAVLALGVLASGMDSSVLQYYPDLFPHLLRVLEGTPPHYMLHSTTLWALSQNVEWIYEDEERFRAYLPMLLRLMTAPKRKVQENAVSALSAVLDQEQKFLESDGHTYLASNPAYLEAVLTHIAQGLAPGGFQGFQLCILYDAIRVLAEALGTQLATPSGQEKLLKPLLEYHLVNANPTEHLVLPQLLCTLNSVVAGLGSHFAPYRVNLYNHCLGYYGKFFEAQFRVRDGAMRIEDVPDFGQNPTMAMDLITTFLFTAEEDEADLEQVKQMILHTKYPGTDFGFLDLVLVPLTQPEVLSSWKDIHDQHFMKSINFVGEFMKPFAGKLAEPVMQALPSLFLHLKEDTDLCNDMAWFLGQFMHDMAGNMSPEQQQALVGQIANHLVPILVAQAWDKNLLMNVAVAVGKVAQYQPQMLAPALDSFFVPLVHYIGETIDSGGNEEQPSERAVAFEGVTKMLAANFSVLEDPVKIKALAKAMNKFINLDQNYPSLHHKCVEIASNLRNALGGAWGQLQQYGIVFPDSILRSLG